MTTAWAHLPNAAHIDAVLADVKVRPEVWIGAWGIAKTPIRSQVINAALDRVIEAGRYDVWVAARRTASAAIWGQAKIPARDALLALLAWDDSAALLDQPPEVLRAMADLADAPVCHQAALLLPYAIVRSNAKQEVT